MVIDEGLNFVDREKRLALKKNKNKKDKTWESVNRLTSTVKSILAQWDSDSCIGKALHGLLPDSVRLGNVLKLSCIHCGQCRQFTGASEACCCAERSDIFL